MPSTDVLEAAGRRAALGPVPAPPSLDALNAEVDRRRTKKRRAVGGGIATVAALVAIPLGVAFVGNADPEVNVATEGVAEATSDEPASLAAPIDSSQPVPEGTATSLPPLDAIESTPGASLERGPFDGLNDENFDLDLNLGDMSFSIEVISGDDAAGRAAEAEAAADETRDVDGQAVWIDNQGENIAASAMFDDETSDHSTFVQVTGPAEQVERILGLVTEHANGPVRFFDLDGFADRFDLPEGVFDGEGAFDGDFPFGEDFPLAPFFEDGSLDDFRAEMEDFAECMDITVDRTGETTSIEIPDCEFPQLDGLFDGEAFGNLPFDFDRLLDDLPENMDELFNGLDGLSDELESTS